MAKSIVNGVAKNKDIPKEVSNVKFISNLLNSKSIDTKIDELIKPYITD